MFTVPKTYRCTTLCVVLVVCSPAFFLGDVEAATAKTSCLLQASDIRLQTNNSDATISFARRAWDDPAQTKNLQRIKWAFAIAFVLAGSRTLYQEALAATSQEKGGKKRDALWDVTRAALMVLIINFHGQMYSELYTAESYGFNWFLGFFMPAYFIISGMFSKRRGDSYWSNVLVSNVINACLFAPIYAYFPSVRTLWFLWALAAYRALLQPLLAACHGHLGRCVGTGAGLLVAVAFDYAFTTIPLSCFAILNFDSSHQTRIGFHAVFFAIGFALDVETVRQILQRKITLVISFLYMSCHIWLCFGTYLQSQDLKGKLFLEDIPNDLTPFSYPLGWTLVVAQRTFASLCFMALCVPLADAESSCMRFLCQIFALSGKRTLYAYCLQFYFIEKLEMIWLQLLIDAQMLNLLPTPYNMCPHQCMQVLFMFSLCSPLAERMFHFVVSPQWVLDCFAGAKTASCAKN